MIPEPIMRILAVLAILAPVILILFGIDINPLIDLLGQGTAAIVALVVQIVAIVSQVIEFLKGLRKVQRAGFTFRQYIFLSGGSYKVLYG